MLADDVQIASTTAEAAPSKGRSWARWMRRLVLGAGAFLVAGNVAIIAVSLLLGQFVAPSRPAAIAGVANLAVVDAKVWRSAAPTMAGYQGLADAGVTTVVDLRAEDGVDTADTAIRAMGLDVVHLPIRDGQTPSEPQVAAFLAIVSASKGTVVVHCGAGVGRSGAMAAAYLVATGQASALRATVRNLAIGPPSLEQLAFSLSLTADDADGAPLPIVAVSRILDAPRRLWSRF